MNKGNLLTFREEIREELLYLTDLERKRQVIYWGDEFDNKNTPNDWSTYITRYASRASDRDFDPKLFADNMIKVAALAIAAVESLRANEDQMPKRHYDE